MTTFGERLDEHLRYLFHGHRSDAERDRAAGVILDLNPQSVEKYRKDLRGPRNVMDLVAIADKLGAGLEYLCGRAKEPRWSPDILKARKWLAPRLSSIDATDYTYRILHIIYLLQTHLDLAKEDWFMAGVLGITVEEYVRLHTAGDEAELSDISLVRFADFMDIPVMWLRLGDTKYLSHHLFTEQVSNGN